MAISSGTLDGGKLVRVLQVNDGAVLTLTSVTLRRGHTNQRGSGAGEKIPFLRRIS